MNSKPAYYKETIHNQKRRAPWHNYYDRGAYMVTISKHATCPTFGTLSFSQPEDATISLSYIGQIIKEQIEVTPSFSPELQIHDYVIMPDHLHILIQVTEPIERHLGEIIQAIKAASTSRCRRALNDNRLILFETGFHDRIITSQDQFKIVRRYIRENARRLAVRRANPGFFRRVNQIVLEGEAYQAYGNIQLMDNPFKEQVVVHRADSPETKERNRELWLYTAANGGVLVSPFISQAEKAIRNEAEAVGGRIILIQNEPFPERYKPTGHNFELCEAGRMLIIAPMTLSGFSRSECLKMNNLAASVMAQC